MKVSESQSLRVAEERRQEAKPLCDFETLRLCDFHFGHEVRKPQRAP
jgi:hypothetical protein